MLESRNTKNRWRPSLKAIDPQGKRQVISLGSWCLTRNLINICGFKQPTYPFDDIFCSIPVLIDCLSENFLTLLDFDKCLTAGNSTSWTPQRYHQFFGEKVTFAHHDVRLANVRSKLKRRVERFNTITAADNPLLVLISYADRFGTIKMLDRLRAQIDLRFGHSHLLIIMIGTGCEDVEHAGLRNSSFWRLNDCSQVGGLQFSDPADDRLVIELIRRTFEETKK